MAIAGSRPNALLRFSALLLATALGGLGCGDEGLPDDSVDGAARCATDSDCDDGVYCNGAEVCAPGVSGAGADGCLPVPSECPTDRCDEPGRRCVDDCAAGEDLDGDGVTAISCGGTDCDDMDPDRFPGNPEVCDAAGVDEDCDPTTLGPDADGDGAVGVECCYDDGRALTCGSDCDDGSDAIRPGATEVCNGTDEDCDGSIDETLPVRFYGLDCDGDGFGDVDRALVVACAAPEDGAECEGGAWVTNATDCDDSAADVSPAAAESCDGQDEDCDARVDEGLPLFTYAQDCDGDGFGDASSEPMVGCAIPAGAPACGGEWSQNRGDCDDDDRDTNPAASERCDLGDDDCDGRVDEALPVASYAPDCDLDGYGDATATPVFDCQPPSASPSCAGGVWVGVGGDCDDDESGSNPGLTESCDGVDNDCDGRLDEGPAGTSLQKPCWPDTDRDGYAELGTVATGVCTVSCPPGTTEVEPFDTDRADCDDSATSVRELVLGREDRDGDGVGGAEVMGCPTDSGFIVGTAGEADCDDGNADVFPGQTAFFETPRGYACNTPGYSVYCGDTYKTCGDPPQPPPNFDFGGCFEQSNVVPAVPIFDYDCDPTNTAPPTSDRCGGCGACQGGYVWTDTIQCGSEVDFETCANTCSLVGIKFCNVMSTDRRILPCR